VNWEHAAIGLLSFVTGVFGWLLREMWDAVKQLRRDLEALRVNLAENYPNYTRLEQLFVPMREQLDRIENALLKKVDRQ
jgi:hypothetical protein